MRMIHHWAVRCLAVASLITALPASAHYQFTYTSQSLPLSSYAIEGSPQDINEIFLPAPAFSLSFTSQEQTISRSAVPSFYSNDLRFSLISPDANYIDYPILIDPSSYGQVTLGEDGKVAGWDFMVQMTELITPETDMLFHKMHDHHVNVLSNSENGDQMGYRFHPITWHGEWIQLVQLDINFAEAKNRGTWTVEKITLPEPGVAGLLLSGLAVLIWTRRRNKGAPAMKKYV